MCDHIAKTHAAALDEDNGVVHAERDGIRWLLYEASSPSTVWRETWQVLYNDPTALTPPNNALQRTEAGGGPFPDLHA